jgi:hypothetical protein
MHKKNKGIDQVRFKFTMEISICQTENGLFFDEFVKRFALDHG